MPPVRPDQFVRFGEHMARHTELGDSSAQALSQELDIPYTTVESKPTFFSMKPTCPP